jgi:hypothetical protein
VNSLKTRYVTTTRYQHGASEECNEITINNGIYDFKKGCISLAAASTGSMAQYDRPAEGQAGSMTGHLYDRPAVWQASNMAGQQYGRPAVCQASSMAGQLYDRQLLTVLTARNKKCVCSNSSRFPDHPHARRALFKQDGQTD